MSQSDTKVNGKRPEHSRVESRLTIEEASSLKAELQSARLELREIKTQFQAIYNHHFQLTGLLDADGRLQMANQTALNQVGAELRDVVGKLFWDTPWWTHSAEEHGCTSSRVGCDSCQPGLEALDCG